MPVRASGQKVRQVWTPEEDRILSHAVAKGECPVLHPSPALCHTSEAADEARKAMETSEHGPISWHKIASHLPGRNNKDCRKRWHYSIAHTIRKGTWTKEEDEKLLGAVDKYGARWSKVAVVVGSRNGDQCWKRWYDCLDPRIDKSAWTAEEVSSQGLLRKVRPWLTIVFLVLPVPGCEATSGGSHAWSQLVRDRDQALPEPDVPLGEEPVQHIAAQTGGRS